MHVLASNTRSRNPKQTADVGFKCVHRSRIRRISRVISIPLVQQVTFRRDRSVVTVAFLTNTTDYVNAVASYPDETLHKPPATANARTRRVLDGHDENRTTHPELPSALGGIPLQKSRRAGFRRKNTPSPPQQTSQTAPGFSWCNGPPHHRYRRGGSGGGEAVTGDCPNRDVRTGPAVSGISQCS